MTMSVTLMVSAAIFNDKGKMLVVRRSPGAKSLPGYWMVVGGKFEEQDASVEAGVIREAKEETGIDVEPVRPLHVEKFRRDDKPEMVAVEITYLCRPKAPASIALFGREHDNYRWIGKNDIDSLKPVSDLTRNKLRKIFEAYMAPDWNEAYASGRDYSPVDQQFLEGILAQGIKKGNALDIGCGTGDLAVKLARHGYHVTGVDLSSIAVQKAKKRAGAAEVGDKTDFLVLDITDPGQAAQFDGKKYELIMCKSVLAFISDKTAFLAWIKDHLAPDGRVILITPVLHPGVDYSPKLLNISVNYEVLIALLDSIFDKHTEVARESFDEQGDKRTFVLG